MFIIIFVIIFMIIFKAPGWFDTECRMARVEVLGACETANQGHMSHIDAAKTCKNYRSTKQRKKTPPI